MKEKTYEMLDQMDAAMSNMLAIAMKNSRIETLFDEKYDDSFRIISKCMLIWKAVKKYMIEQAEMFDNMDEKLDRIETLLKNKI